MKDVIKNKKGYWVIKMTKRTKTNREFPWMGSLFGPALPNRGNIICSVCAEVYPSDQEGNILGKMYSDSCWVFRTEEDSKRLYEDTKKRIERNLF
jgi:hypothetical protein